MIQLPEQFELSVHDEDKSAVVTVRGEIDLATAPEVAQVLGRLIDGGRHDVVMDLGNMSFMDSSGLRVLVTAYQRLVALEGSLAIRSPQPIVTRALRLTNLDRVIPVL